MLGRRILALWGSTLIIACGPQESRPRDVLGVVNQAPKAESEINLGDQLQPRAAFAGGAQEAVAQSCVYAAGNCGRGSSCALFEDEAGRGPVKQQIWNAMYYLNEAKLGWEEASCRADLAVAIAMQESHSFVVRNGLLPYDASKDWNTDGSQNVSVFNMNIDFIRLSCQQGCEAFQNYAYQEDKKYLNRVEYLEEAVRRLNEGFEYFGVEPALYFHRGGRTGWRQPTSDEYYYAWAQKVAANYLKTNPYLRTNGIRVSSTIKHR